MSKASYIRNEHVYWVVLVSFSYSGKEIKYLHRGCNQSYTGSIEDARAAVGPWAKLPSFKAKVVGIKYT